MTYVDDEDDDMVVIDFRFKAVCADYFRFIIMQCILDSQMN